jgi:uncharacterized protein YlxP (DUF503 family)
MPRPDDDPRDHANRIRDWRNGMLQKSTFVLIFLHNKHTDTITRFKFHSYQHVARFGVIYLHSSAFCYSVYQDTCCKRRFALCALLRMAEAVALMPQGSFPSQNSVSYNAELSQYEGIIKLHDEIIAGRHPRIKYPFPSKEGETGILSIPIQVPNATPVLPAVIQQNGLVSQSFAPQFSSDVQSLSNPPTIFKQNDVLLYKPEAERRVDLKQERRLIEHRIEQKLQQKISLSKSRNSEQDVLPEFDVSKVLADAQEIVKPIQLSETNIANRQESTSRSIEERDYYSSQVGETLTDESDDHNPKKKVTKPCRFHFE